ncbi:MAG TPA: FADH(2)-oxidizing methylenetetrahydrofolate--tRNA-(uracil(54)-C(5))-methyltransferase TrmFO, partial [Clostridiales bacterium]|nr:FADH(2)-oxidizing methylenetetrahydrofolate--tRNA-(uracil(54)-C(5))-methyltransferase TrmFO [Clostridiales bacterium]
MKVKVIGAGLAGSEAALYLAKRGVEVELYDIKPARFTPAHSDKNFGELVCSNSLKGSDPY